MSQIISPVQDTGWGVIYRLNNLFAEVETLAPSGKYDEWNIKLDRIWSNLCYRTPMKTTKDSEGNIKEIKFETCDYDEKNYFDNQILKAKSDLKKASKGIKADDLKKNKEYIRAKKSLYRSLLSKEIWLRKYMYKLGLYLKESKHNPAGAMWGK